MPPHFHAIYGDDEAMIDIRTGALIRGSLPRRAFSLVDEWRAAHIAELMDDWQGASQRLPLAYIAPLE